MLKFTVIGLFQGATYGLLAIGLVLVYRGTKTFNFAQGEFGGIAAFTTYALAQNAGLPYALAALIGIVCAVLAGLIVERLVVRPLLHAPRITLLVATLGVALFIISLTIVAAAATPRTLKPAVAGESLLIFGAGISRQLVLLVVVLALLAPVLIVFFRTNLGLAVLAASQDELATRVVGISVPGMSRFVWGFAALLGGIAGLLQGPVKGLFFPGFMTLEVLIPAFTAAVLGGFTSLPGAFLGGAIVGVSQALATSSDLFDFIPGQAGVVIAFVLLVGVLSVRPNGLLGGKA